ncbi:hypothetical protein KAI58_02630 [Candidatus Gracilibacteria bacterium]|nr:hypothetical protein [Candidatus Gracilibacteria bacterium]
MSEKKDDSFLNEAQQFGKASGKMEIENLDTAIKDVNKILIKEAADEVHKKKEEDLLGIRLAIYCHDCRAIVPPELRQRGRRMRKVCGNCGSVKISAGREAALNSFYHLEDK